jgi:hypothetical protein
MSMIQQIKKFNKFTRISSHGILRCSRTSIPSLWTVPAYVSCHSAWEPALHPGCLFWLPTPHPHIFFLSNLSLADITFISTTILKMIIHIQTHSRVISYGGWLIQMSLFLFCVFVDDMFLIVMKYDQFVITYHSLHYPGIWFLLESY